MTELGSYRCWCATHVLECFVAPLNVYPAVSLQQKCILTLTPLESAPMAMSLSHITSPGPRRLYLTAFFPVGTDCCCKFANVLSVKRSCTLGQFQHASPPCHKRDCTEPCHQNYSCMLYCTFAKAMLRNTSASAQSFEQCIAESVRSLRKSRTEYFRQLTPHFLPASSEACERQSIVHPIVPSLRSIEVNNSEQFRNSSRSRLAARPCHSR